MNYTKEQRERLAPYADNFRTAVQARWSRPLPASGIETIVSVYNAATGQRRHLTSGCGTCALKLLIDAGRLYFADLDALASAAKRKAAKKKEVEK